MKDIKDKVLGDLQGFLDGRLSQRLKPDVPEVKRSEIMGGDPGPDGIVEGSDGSLDPADAKKPPGFIDDGKGEPGTEKIGENEEGGKVEEIVELLGGDLEKLSDEEKQMLLDLYHKMGC